MTRSPDSFTADHSISDQHDLLLLPPRHLRFARTGEHVYFTAHAEFWKINSWLDGEASVGQDLAFVFGFEVVDVRAIAVDRVADVMSSAMNELVPITLALNELADSLVDFPAGNL